MQSTSGSDRIVIYADTGEKGTKIIKILEKKCRVRKKRLSCGDYLLSSSVVAERKTSADFVSSIVDGRLFRQIREMKKTYPSPLLVVEGESMFNNGRKVHPNALRGAVASIAVDMRIPIIWTGSQHETAEMLYSIARREQLHIKNSVSIRSKKKTRSDNEDQIFLVSGLPKISSRLSKRLLEYFGSPLAVFNASETELQKVEGVGKEMARRVRRILEKKYEKPIL